MKSRFAAILVVAALSGCAGQTPDTVIINGKIFTSSASQPWVQALAIRGDRIIAIGDTAVVSRLAGSSTIARTWSVRWRWARVRLRSARRSRLAAVRSAWAISSASSSVSGAGSDTYPIHSRSGPDGLTRLSRPTIVPGRHSAESGTSVLTS